MNSFFEEMKGQLTLRGIIVGVIGCAIITASSVYVALKMGALPWPIVFAAILSLFTLKAISRNKSTVNEANVTHTVMSSGAMVAGGLAFTIPGAWMSGLAGDISFTQMLVIAVCGSAMGLVGSVALRRHFVCDAKLEYPIGQAAAQTLVAGDTGGKTGAKLFGALGISGVYTFLRDGLRLLPSMLCALPIPGVSFGIYNSPMMLAVGFLVGKWMVIAWFLGALIANFGIIVAGGALGFGTTEFLQQVVSSLGMGVMMGCGIAVIVKDIIPKAAHMARNSSSSNNKKANSNASNASGNKSVNISAGIIVLAICVVAICLALKLSFWISLIVVACAFVACAMSAQSVGQTGIDPMEIFGLLALLLVAAISQTDEVRLFFVAALVAVACGLAGDVMNDFKAGHVLNTSPRAQWVGQAIGALVGSIVAVVVMQLLLGAYGPEAFGQGKEFVSAQASVVATLVQGIPVPAAFWIGLACGFVLYIAKLPAMMIGLGIYLPFYMSFTAFLGVLVKVAYDGICKIRMKGLSSQEAASKKAREEESALVIASGALGGESIVGIILALVVSSALIGI